MWRLRKQAVTVRMLVFPFIEDVRLRRLNPNSTEGIQNPVCINLAF